MSDAPDLPVIDPSATLAPLTDVPDRIVVEAHAVVENGVTFAKGGERPIRIGEGARIEAGAVIGRDVEIGRGAIVMAGAVVHSNVPANAVVRGNPAAIIGYATGLAGGSPAAAMGIDHRVRSARPLGAGGASLHQMTKVTDLRGSLSVGEFDASFPFVPRRYFLVFDVPSEELRGEHAHRVCEQFLICVQGSCRALLDDGDARVEVTLDDPSVGLHMPPMIWGTQYRYSRDAVLLVLASHHYDAGDYIRSYEEFRAEKARLSA